MMYLGVGCYFLGLRVRKNLQREIVLEEFRFIVEVVVGGLFGREGISQGVNIFVIFFVFCSGRVGWRRGGFGGVFKKEIYVGCVYMNMFKKIYIYRLKC